MNLDPSSLLLSIFISLIGAALLLYGRREARGPHIIVGLVLVVFPYFVGNLWLELVIAGALLGGLWVASRLGY
jgi:hypothetical protein